MTRLRLAGVLALTATVCAAALITQAIAGASQPWLALVPYPTPVDVTKARQLPCTRGGIGTGLMAFAGLVNQRRFGATRLLWLPKRRLPTPAFFRIVAVNGDRARVRADLGVELPAAARSWVADGLPLVEMIHIDTRPNRRQPANSGIVIAWARFPSDGTEGLRLGRGKGVWDCEKRRIAMWFGSEIPVADEAEARNIAAGQCRHRRGNSTLHRYGQTALLCGLPRGYRG